MIFCVTVPEILALDFRRGPVLYKAVIKPFIKASINKITDKGSNIRAYIKNC